MNFREIIYYFSLLLICSSYIIRFFNVLICDNASFSSIKFYYVINRCSCISMLKVNNMLCMEILLEVVYVLKVFLVIGDYRGGGGMGGEIDR